jgi:hypothetical protein
MYENQRKIGLKIVSIAINQQNQKYDKHFNRFLIAGGFSFPKWYQS